MDGLVETVLYIIRVEDVDSKMSLELCRKCEVNKDTFILL